MVLNFWNGSKIPNIHKNYQKIVYVLLNFWNGLKISNKHKNHQKMFLPSKNVLCFSDFFDFIFKLSWFSCTFFNFSNMLKISRYYKEDSLLDKYQDLISFFSRLSRCFWEGIALYSLLDMGQRHVDCIPYVTHLGWQGSLRF